MLKFSQWLVRSDEDFVSRCMDPSKREGALRRQSRNLLLCVLAALLAVVFWFAEQRSYLAGAGERSAGADFVFLCLMVITIAVSLFWRSNIRLLLGLRALEEKAASAREG